MVVLVTTKVVAFSSTKITILQQKIPYYAMNGIISSVLPWISGLPSYRINNTASMAFLDIQRAPQVTLMETWYQFL